MTFIYYKYDGLNRIIRGGQSTTALQHLKVQIVNNNGWPAADNTVKASYLYTRLDSPNLASVTFYDEDENSSVYNYDLYDDRGRLSTMTVDLHGLATREIKYVYDRQGQITQILFEDGKSRCVLSVVCL